MQEVNSEYFPPLDRCLEGQAILFSWASAFVALASTDSANDRDTALERFLSDKQTSQLLVRPFHAFPAPTPQSKSAFESGTAAIHIAPSSTTQKDVEQLKEDALWLSKEAKLNEVSALRIAVVEWQSRPAAQLLSGDSAEDVTFPPNAGSNTPGSSLFLPRSSTVSKEPGSHGQLTRRLRLLRLYLSERRHFLKVVEMLVQAGLSDNFTSAGQDKGKSRTTWVEAVGKTILNARFSGDNSGTGTESFLTECIDGLQSRVQGLLQPSGFLSNEGDPTKIQPDWERCLLMEMIHIMQLIFDIVDATKAVPSTKLVLAWFGFASRYRFFDATELAAYLAASAPPFLSFLQALVSIVSLAMLKMTTTLALLLDEDERPEPRTPSFKGPFITDASGISDIHTIFMNAAEGAGAVISPALFAWSIILQTLNDVLSKDYDGDDQEPQQAVDGSAEADASNTEGESSATEDGSDRQILRRPSRKRSIFGDVGPEAVLNALEASTKLNTSVRMLAMRAVEDNRVYDIILSLATEHCKVFSSAGHGNAGRRMRLMLLDLIQASLEWVQYSPDVIAGVLGVLTGGEDFWSIPEQPDPAYDLDPVLIFMDDNSELVPKILDVAYARFPLEMVPFLKLVRALHAHPRLDENGLPLAVSLLDNMRTLTLSLPDDFHAFDTVQEDENVGQLVSRTALGVFMPRRRMVSGPPSNQMALVAATSPQPGGGLVIPADTEGLFSSATPSIVQWRFQYSGLQYVGMLLESGLPSGSLVDSLTHAETSKDIIAEAVGVLAVLLTVIKKVRSKDGASATIEATQALLGKASDGLGCNADIITVVVDHLENESEDVLNASDVARPMELLVNCTHFIYALTSILPGRVWPFFARSRLLGVDGRGGRLADLVARTEMVTGRYEFLIGCIRIFEALVDEAIDHAVARKTLGSKTARSPLQSSLGTGISEQVMGKVVLSFEQILIDVFRSYSNWKFLLLEERLEIGTRILKVFKTILFHTHSVDASAEPHRKLLSMLVPAANYLVDVFLSPLPSSLPIDSLIQIFADAVDTPFSTLFFGTAQLWVRQTVSALEFCDSLLRINMLLQRSRSQLESRLFEASPLLVRIFGSGQSYKLPAVTLLDAMITSAALAEGEPPSLLGHLGRNSADHFINLLSLFNEPVGHESLEVAVWNFMSTILGSRQQWFAINFLTGRAPRASLRPDDGDATPRRLGSASANLSFELNKLTDLLKQPGRKTWAMAEFVVFAGDYWPWTVPEIRKHERFMTSALDLLGELHTHVDFNDPSKAQGTCNALRTAALICEVLAICLHDARSLGDRSLAAKILPKISYLVSDAVVVRGYNESLHANLKRNFEARFPGCSLSMFKRTKLQRAELGEKYYYDVDLAERMLSYDSSWHGMRGDGLAEELTRANVNLSLVEAQVLLLYSWRTLVLELSHNLSSEPSLQDSIAQVVNGCLEANGNRNLPEDIFDQLLRARSDVAFVLMQRLAEVRAAGPEMKKILFTTWNTMQSSDINFELAMIGGDVEYYRFLLKILFLSLQPHSTDPAPPGDGVHRSSTTYRPGVPSSSEIQRVIKDVLDVVVARGLRHLTVAVHENPGRSSPEDIALVTAILQTALRIPSVEAIQAQICTRFADQETARVATTLYSWSDQLAINGDDPVYGELALLFLVDLSSMPLMAEQLAVDGVLSQLSNAPLTALLRRGVRPLDRNRRPYTIWVRGVVPLCLNLLQAIGPPIAPEVSSFLAQFAKQLSISSHHFDNKPSSASLTRTTTTTTTARTGGTGNFFTLSMASEAHSLALIHRILESFRAAGASTGVPASEIVPLQNQWDAAGVKEDLEYWLSRRVALRDRLLPMGVVEEDMARQKISPLLLQRKDQAAVAAASEDRFEEKFVAEITAVVGLLS